MCLDPCHEFAGAEGLCHVIVRPKAKPADLVDIGLTCRHDDDWDIEFGPDAAAEIESIDMREHEIQDDEVETTAQRSYLSFGAVFLNHYLKIRCFQIIPLQLCDLTIILHDEDFFMMLIPSSRLSLRYLVFFLLVLFGKPQADAKAMRQGRAGPDAPAHRLDDLCRDSQPEAAALCHTCPRLIRAIE